MRSVYVMAHSEAGPCKVGVSGNVERRRIAISRARRDLTVYFQMEHLHAYGIESMAHKELALKAMGGEWFECTVPEAEKVIRLVSSQEYADRLFERCNCENPPLAAEVFFYLPKTTQDYLTENGYEIVLRNIEKHRARQAEYRKRKGL